MRKNSRISLAMILVFACTVFLPVTAYASGGNETQLPGDLLTGCEMYQRFSKINDAWREGRITDRELVLKEARAFYEGSSSPTLTCEDGILDQLRQELFEDVYRLSDELGDSDRYYLKSLDVEMLQALDLAIAEVGEAGSPVVEGASDISSRIGDAEREGRISLKESVLLRAQLRHAPHLIPAGSEFAPTPHESYIAEECGTGFYKDLHRVRQDLTEEEKSLLRALSPDLDAIVRLWEGIAPNALPIYPDLDKQYEGKNCMVHYTLTGTNAVSNAEYAKWVALYIDDAIKAQTKLGHFRPAYAEGGGKLHIYCLDLAFNGQWIDGSDVAGTGKRKSGYILISRAIDSQFGALWKTKLKGLAHHEYFHGVQSAYNWESDLWFMEATTVWASCYYGADWPHVGAYYTDADSIFNRPNQFIWVNNYHKYSMSTLAFFLSGKYGGYGVIRTYFEKSEGVDDAVLNLRSTLAFGDVFKQFLVYLYAKKIPSIKKYMPDVKFETTHSNYGVPLTNGNVALLGANFYKLEVPTDTRLRTAPLIAILEKGTVGDPQGALVAKGATQAAPTKDGRSYLPKTKEAVLIVTDVDYATQDVSSRPYQYSVVTPYIRITKVTAVSPIPSGGTSNIHILYNLLGTVPGWAQSPGQRFPVTLKVIEKGPGVDDRASGTYDLPAGGNQDLPLYFITGYGAQGTYRFTFQLAVPCDAWMIPQMKSKGSCTVVVLPPTSRGARSKASALPSGVLQIRH